MHIHHHWTGLPASARGTSVAMGNFDGVHRGHRSVIDRARAAADALDAPTDNAGFGQRIGDFLARRPG